MKTKGALVSDIELRLSRGKPSNDFEIERSQIEHWLDLARDEIVSQKLNSQIMSDEDIDPFYIAKFGEYSAELEQEVALACTKRHVFSLDKDILSLVEDRGIDRVVATSGKILIQSTFDQIEYLQDLWFSKPSNENMMWYREGNKFFVYGLSDITRSRIKFQVFGVQSNVGSTLSDEDKYPISDDITEIVIEKAEEIGLRELYGELEDRSSDGNQPPKEVK